ncbi:formate dehydrogenase (quinone-dependent) catalytic subunit [Sporomusa sp. KB1]|jgi:formate dehydrogenase major subunit|nr:formate dehydrogenase (quinone-dependent) catalytic subunit [Sporomusa sp. KB1]
MTNSWTDLENAKWFLIAGSNAAENHPIAMKYLLRAQEKGAKIIVVDPRFTRTAAKANLFAQIRPGTDIAYLGAIINYILQNSLYNKEYLVNFTNALCKINSAYEFKDGLFSGYDSTKGSYATDSWSYVLDEQGQPVKAASLEEPGTVFSLMKQHYSRYTLETGSAISGIPAEAIKQIADIITKNGIGTIMYALGMTQHTTATQGIRCYAIIQLLLGNIGVAGGGVNALRGEPNVQGSTDFSNLSTTLPGYLPTPMEEDKDTTTYGMKYGSTNLKHLISLQKAWYGEKATADNDYAYGYLPRIPTGKATSYIPMTEDMSKGQFKLLFNIGINPRVSIPNNAVVQSGLAKLEMMVVSDFFETETASFWKAPGVNSAEIKTEVIFLPVAFSYEKAGSLTNSGRWIQWKAAALKPEGTCRADLDIFDSIFRKVRSLYAGSTDPKDAPILHSVWDYGHEADPEKVLQEINGYNMTTGKLLGSLGEYLAGEDGQVSSGCWIYSGVYGNGNLAKRRDGKDPGGLGLFPQWTYAWPANIRILYNRASCDRQGQPLDSTRQLVWWDLAKSQWVGNDVPDVSDRSKGPDTPQGKTAFRMNADQMARLFTAPFKNMKPGTNLPATLAGINPDGPLPEFYEPIESPTINVLHPKVQINPLAKVRQAIKEKQQLGGKEEFPFVLTTYTSGTEHFCSGSLTRNLPWLVEFMPEPFLEMGKAMASKLGVTNGEVVELSSARGVLQVKAMVTDRIQPLVINGQETHTVGMPFGWGYAGLGTGPSVNNLTHAVFDPAAGTPEFKAQLVNVRKVK